MTHLPFLPQAALVTLAVSSLPAAGAATGLDGEWCQPDWGTALFWEDRSLGLGEHRICDWDEPPAGRTDISTMIHCRQIYLNGDQVVETDHKTHRFRATAQGDDRLQIQFDDDAPVTLTRCDH